MPCARSQHLRHGRVRGRRRARRRLRLPAQGQLARGTGGRDPHRPGGRGRRRSPPAHPADLCLRQDRAARASGPAPARRREHHGLTPRGVEVWRLLAAGLDNNEIGHPMEISVSTVKNYITSIFDELGVRDRAQAVIAAYESGLVTARQAIDPD
ncbi:response regulator transcription factor [Kitasatospora sp. CMC57]